MINPKISVIVPVYNVEKYLSRCLESILAQSYADFELLLVVDGSPDNSALICQEYAERDGRIQVYVKENGGVSSARNFGLDKAQGDWIAFIDSDDWVAPDFLLTLIQAASSSVDVLELRQKACRRGDFYTYIATPDFFFSVWNRMFRTSVVRSIRFNQQLKIGEDLLFIIEIFQKTNRIKVIQSPVLYNYNIREGSAMTSLRSQIDSAITLSRYLYDTIGADTMFLPIYYRLVADNRNETDKQKMKILVRSTIGKFSLIQYIRHLIKDPVLCGKCLVRTLQAYI